MGPGRPKFAVITPVCQAHFCCAVLMQAEALQAPFLPEGEAAAGGALPTVAGAAMAMTRAPPLTKDMQALGRAMDLAMTRAEPMALTAVPCLLLLPLLRHRPAG